MIKIFWFGGDSITKNFGDEIGPYLVRKLTGKEVVFWKPTFLGQLKTTVLSIFKAKGNFLRYFISWFEFDYKILFTVGSILAVANKRSLIWGSGYMSKDNRSLPGRIYAVRGQMTQKQLQLQNIKIETTFGDPALLLPIVYNSKLNIKPEFEIGIIPHISEYNYFQVNYSKYKIINLRNENVEEIIDEITNCRFILSSSLHGLIVAHAYKIPALWIERRVLEKDGFKFEDYFSSVGIENYRGFSNIEDILKNKETVFELFKNNIDISMIQFSLINIQKELLKVAPFVIMKDYKEYVNDDIKTKN